MAFIGQILTFGQALQDLTGVGTGQVETAMAFGQARECNPVRFLTIWKNRW